MAVISVVSLKGGVGKTTLSLNIAAAFAKRGCETALIDLDPMGHASRFFERDAKFSGYGSSTESPLARLFLASDLDEENFSGSLLSAAAQADLQIVSPGRDRLSIVHAGPELRLFLWGKGKRAFKAFFPRFVAELESQYDVVVIDTPPDYNVLTRNAIGSSSVSVVPVDSSAMSIHCLEEIINSSSHLKKPVWAIARTMVNKQAVRVQKLSAQRIRENLPLTSCEGEDSEENPEGNPLSNGHLHEIQKENQELISMIGMGEEFDFAANDEQERFSNESDPIYMLNTQVSRTETQNRLTFERKTAFDTRDSAKLAEQYLGVARELEFLLSFSENDNTMVESKEFFPADYEQERAAAS